MVRRTVCCWICAGLFAGMSSVERIEAGQPKLSIGPESSKARARKKDFDAQMTIPCAQEQGQSLGKCAASVARGAHGDATVEVRFSNGFARQLYFMDGKFLRGSATMSGVGTDMEWSVRQGTYAIRVDDQRFEIPEAFVTGQ